MWRSTPYRWIWQRGLKQYVLRRKVLDEDDFSQCGPNLDDLVAAAMLKWGLTKAEMTRDEAAAQLSAAQHDKGRADEEDVPATQPYPEEVLCVREPQPDPEDKCGNRTGPDSYDDRGPPVNMNCGAATFVVAAMTPDPRMLPGDIADLEGRAVGRTYKHCQWLVRERVGRDRDENHKRCGRCRSCYVLPC